MTIQDFILFCESFLKNLFEDLQTPLEVNLFSLLFRLFLLALAIKITWEAISAACRPLSKFFTTNLFFKKYNSHSVGFVRSFLNNLIETKRTWHRVKIINKELKITEEIEDLKNCEDITVHQANISKLVRQKKQNELGLEEDGLKHQITINSLKKELSPPSLKEKIVAEKQDFLLQRLRLKLADRIQLIGGTQPPEPDCATPPAPDLKKYQDLRGFLTRIHEEGIETETVKELLSIVDHHYEFNRDNEDHLIG